MLEVGHNEIVDLIPAYVLGSLEAEEAALVERHLAECDTCRREAAAYAAVADTLLLAAPLVEPPADLRGRVMGTIRATTAPDVGAPERHSWRQMLQERAARFRQGPRWRPALLLGLLLLLLGIIFLWPRTASSPAPVVELTPTDAAPGASGLLAFGEGDGAGMLTVNGLPVLPAEEQYQLWLIVDGQRASGAIFSVDAAGGATVTVEAERPLAEYGAFGITIEPAGGSPGPTGERVLGFNL